MKKRALISVSSKENIESFAKGLVEQDYEIISTGGTLTAIQDAGIPARAVETLTDFAEILDRLVKTSHPLIHGGLLADIKNQAHAELLKYHAIQPLDTVVVNLYPFTQTLANARVSVAEIVGHIDIGGPTMS